jgi:ubiquinone/menaquinone biosynthesis C-methylase UbiE
LTASDASSYRIGEGPFDDVSSELERLRVQAALVWPDELRTLVRHGLREDATLLEVGCGPGFVTSRLLDHLRRGSVTGVDLDPTMLAHARELLGGSERVRFVEASASERDFPTRRSTPCSRGSCSSICRTSTSCSPSSGACSGRADA